MSASKGRVSGLCRVSSDKNLTSLAGLCASNCGMDVPVITEDAVRRGAAVYSRPVLAIYDLFVLRFTNTFVWKCPSPHILEFYNQNVSDKHLDVGVGTGYFLDRCTFPSAAPQIALMDLNENSLQKTAKRLRRYHPRTYRRNVLEPIEIGDCGIWIDRIELSIALPSRKYGDKAGRLQESQTFAASRRGYLRDNDSRCWSPPELAGQPLHANLQFKGSVLQLQRPAR